MRSNATPLAALAISLALLAGVAHADQLPVGEVLELTEQSFDAEVRMDAFVSQP